MQKKIQVNTIIVDLIDECKYFDDDKEQRRLIKRIKNIVKQDGAFEAPNISLSLGAGCAGAGVGATSSSSSPPTLIHFEKEDDTEKMLSKSILRFIQPRDKITQITSNLLKSWLYHHYHHRYYYYYSQNSSSSSSSSSTSPATSSHSLPIAVLQRTRYRRPYIHLQIPDDYSDRTEESNGKVNTSSTHLKNHTNNSNSNHDHDHAHAHVHASSDSDNNTSETNSNIYCCCKSRKGVDNERNENDGDKQKQRRSKYDKEDQHRKSDNGNTCNEILLSLPFSISHQYPIAALSFITIDPQLLSSHFGHKKQKKEREQAQQISGTPDAVLPLIGLDVVMFNFNSAKGMTVKEFLSMYEASFTKWEWRQINLGRNHDDESDIYLTNTNTTFTEYYDDARESKIMKQQSNNNGTNQLIEFYLRWSMKEAYSKALGLGLGLEFQSFEALLVGFDIPHHRPHEQYRGVSNNSARGSSGRSLWDHILSQYRKNHNEGMVFFPSQIYKMESKTNQWLERDDSWYFIFIPHMKNERFEDEYEKNYSNQFEVANNFMGCSCICIQLSNDANIMKDVIINDDDGDGGDDSNDNILLAMKGITKTSFMSLQDLCNFHSAN